ncbi:MAG TPA: hypothetical protein VMS37_35075 [Verrucomicrobiae bacterium]|nr:hypothetical protein [Verrucomicrobiae bacterium]
MNIQRLSLITPAVALALFAAEAPYAGKWKMNPAKSDFGQTTITYEQLSSGEMQATADGQSYKFKPDGKDYPDPFGNTAAWKSVNATTWETIWKLKGKVLTTDTLTLSPDDKALTIHTKGTKPNGEAIDDSVTFTRVSGGPGLAGKWKTKNLQSSSPSVIELATSGSDGLTFKMVDMGLTCENKLDGKDYPCTGPTLSSGWTLALSKSGARGLDMTVKMNGKLLYKMTYSVSADGKTMTESGSATATNEKFKVVYDRQ